MPQDLPCAELHLRSGVAVETLDLDVDSVNPRHDGPAIEQTSFIGSQFGLQAGGFVGERHSDIGQNVPGSIAHFTHDLSYHRLALDWGHKRLQNQCDTYTHEQELANTGHAHRGHGLNLLVLD